MFLREDTASQVIVLGPFLDSGDGVTAETSLTISNTDIRLSKAGGAFGAKNSGGGTHMENGYYSATLDATDTSTVGILDITVQESGALPVRHRFYVLEEAIYDALFAAGSAVVPANVTQWLGSAAATPTVAGVPEVDVTHWIGTAAATPTVAGVPEVDATHWKGAVVETPVNAGSPLVDLKYWFNDQVTAMGVSGLPKVNLEAVDDNAIIASATGTVPADIRAINNNLTVPVWWDTLLQLAEVLTVTTSSTASSFAASSAAATTDDNYIDRVGIFRQNTTTVALRGRPFYVTDYTGASKTFTVDQLNAVPAVGDTFILLP